MYSSFIRILLALIGLSPILLSLYVVKIIHDFKRFSFYLNLNSFNEIFTGIINFLTNHYLFLIFIFAILLARFLVKKAKRDLPVGRIEVKSVKPGDTNFFALLFSVILPFYKFYDPSLGDMVYLGCFVIIAIVYGITMKESYHFNIILKLFLGYSHFEIATTGEITYLMLSKTKLINRNQISKNVYLTNYMLINVSDKP